MCRSLALGALVLSLAAASSGCIRLVVAGADSDDGPTTVAYSMGDLEGVVEAGPEAVVEAAKGVLENDMKIKVLSAEATSVDGKIVARTATDTKVGVRVKKHAEKVSKISIRVGVFGDEKLSVEIYEKIIARL